MTRSNGETRCLGEEIGSHVAHHNTRACGHGLQWVRHRLGRALKAAGGTAIVEAVGLALVLGAKPPGCKGSAGPCHLVRTQTLAPNGARLAAPSPGPSQTRAPVASLGPWSERQAQSVWRTHTECSRNDVHLWHDSVPIANPAASGPVQPHSVDLVHEGDGAELVGHVTQLLQRAHRP